MNKFLTIGLGAAAVVVAVFVGAQLFGSPTRWVGLVEPTASARADRQPRTDPPVARTIPPAADPELHLDAARDFRVVPRGMDRSSGDRALDG